MFNRSKKDDDPDGGSFLSEATLQELVWQTARVLKEPLALEDPQRILQYLGEPMEDGPYALRIQELMAAVRSNLNPSQVPQYILNGSFLLRLHSTLIKAIQEGLFCTYCHPPDAVLASHLRLHQTRTWQAAIQLIPNCYETDDAATVNERLQVLRQQLCGGAHTHYKT